MHNGRVPGGLLTFINNARFTSAFQTHSTSPQPGLQELNKDNSSFEKVLQVS
jgi:hypothetical protein